MSRQSEIQYLENDQTEILSKCAKVIQEGGVVLIPTDTVYGLSTDYFNSAARQRIFQIKNRPPDKSFITLLPDAATLISFADQKIPDTILAILPEALTLIVLNRHRNLYGEDTLAVRVPRNQFLSPLLKQANGAIISTSANLSGATQAMEPETLVKQFGSLVDLIVIDPNYQPTSPSTILDISQKPYKILRQGSFNIPKSILNQL